MVDGEGTLIPHNEPLVITTQALLNWSGAFFCQPSCFFSHKAWNSCGPLDEKLHFAMDLDLWFKIAAGFPFVRIEHFAMAAKKRGGISWKNFSAGKRGAGGRCGTLLPDHHE